MTGGPGDEKPCTVCGRTIEWRRRFARSWGEVRYCSASCRRTGLGRADEDLEHAIIDLLDQRAGNATICPSEAAKLVGGDDWRPLMEPSRAAARRLVDEGAVLITQRGKVVDPTDFSGPIRIRRAGTGAR